MKVALATVGDTRHAIAAGDVRRSPIFVMACGDAFAFIDSIRPEAPVEDINCEGCLANIQAALDYVDAS